MIKYYCDICGKEIKNNDNVIEVNIARKPKALETDEVGACYEYDH